MPPLSPQDKRCYDEVVGITDTVSYRNVCQIKTTYRIGGSEQGGHDTWGEWGETVPRVRLDQTFRFLGCKGCWYEGVQDCRQGGLCMIMINESGGFRERCPTRHPKYGVGAIIWSRGAIPYFDHWAMINSCWWMRL